MRPLGVAPDTKLHPPPPSLVVTGWDESDEPSFPAFAEEPLAPASAELSCPPLPAPPAGVPAWLLEAAAELLEPPTRLELLAAETPPTAVDPAAPEEPPTRPELLAAVIPPATAPPALLLLAPPVTVPPGRAELVTAVVPPAPVAPPPPEPPVGGGISEALPTIVVTLDPSKARVSVPPEAVTLPSLATFLLEEVVYLSKEEMLDPLIAMSTEVAPPVFTAMMTTSVLLL